MELLLQLDQGVELPEFESLLASGFDVRAIKIITAYKGDTEIDAEKLSRIQLGFNERGFIKLRPFERILFGTGIVADIPSEIELQVRSRSGVALKRGLFVANQPGTIDSDYRGEIGVILYNSTPFLTEIKKGERIAQVVPKFKTLVILKQVDKVSLTSRNRSGFGSTGTQ